MRLLSWLLLCLVPLAAAAQDLPAAYRVTGVAADDTLNVRSGPGVEHGIIDELAPDASGVEVVALSEEGDWGQVQSGGRMGWASMRYLARLEQPADAIPRPMLCRGTEPFWNIHLTSEGASYGDPESGSHALDRMGEAVAPLGYLARFEDARGNPTTLTITRERCSDGMSDLRYGFSARAFVEGEENRLLRGCCTLDSR